MLSAREDSRVPCPWGLYQGTCPAVWFLDMGPTTPLRKNSLVTKTEETTSGLISRKLTNKYFKDLDTEMISQSLEVKLFSQLWNRWILMALTWSQYFLLKCMPFRWLQSSNLSTYGCLIHVTKWLTSWEENLLFSSTITLVKWYLRWSIKHYYNFHHNIQNETSGFLASYFNQLHLIGFCL